MTETKTKRVDPINTRNIDGERVKEEYRFGKVHVEDIPEHFTQKNVDFEKGVNMVRWEYSGKPPILIDEDGVIAKHDAPQTEVQNQAFFALSILADDGYVSRWEKL